LESELDLFVYDLRGVVLIKGEWLWVWFYPELPVPNIWSWRLAGMQVVWGEATGRAS